MVRPQPVQDADLVEARMIAERHLNDFAKCRWVKELTFHNFKRDFDASKVKLPLLVGPITQRR